LVWYLQSFAVLRVVPQKWIISKTILTRQQSQPVQRLVGPVSAAAVWQPLTPAFLPCGHLCHSCAKRDGRTRFWLPRSDKPQAAYPADTPLKFKYWHNQRSVALRILRL
jgi:hypothetical protein